MLQELSWTYATKQGRKGTLFMNQQNPKTGFNQGGNQDAGGFGAGGQSQFGGSQFGGSQFGAGGGGGAGGNPGEFSNAGFGGTNAVSQIFKDGGFDDGKRKRTMFIIAGVVVVGVCGAAAWWLFSGDKTEPEKALEAPLAVTEAPVAVEEEEEMLDEEVPLETSPVAGPALTGGEISVAYDARLGGVTINANAGAIIEVSRSADFSDSYVRGVAQAGAFQIPLPPPGKIYWREQGGAEANVVNISAPESASVSFSAPQTFQKGGSLSWTGSGPVAYYRVEFSTDKEFSNVVSAFATSQTSITPGEVASGSYFVRVGAFNAASGAFQYSSAGNVTVE